MGTHCFNNSFCLWESERASGISMPQAIAGPSTVSISFNRWALKRTVWGTAQVYREGKAHRRVCFCQDGRMKTEWVPALVRESQTNSGDTQWNILPRILFSVLFQRGCLLGLGFRRSIENGSQCVVSAMATLTSPGNSEKHKPSGPGHKPTKSQTPWVGPSTQSFKKNASWFCQLLKFENHSLKTLILPVRASIFYGKTSFLIPKLADSPSNSAG